MGGHLFKTGIVTVTHVLLAVSGVIVLLVAAREPGLRGAGPWALWLFATAALGGLWLAMQHLDRKRLSSGAVVAHAAIAAAAFLVTLTAAILVP